MWPTRSAAFQPGQWGTGRDQSDCAAARRSRPSAAATVSRPGSGMAVCLSLKAGTAAAVPGGRVTGRRGGYGPPGAAPPAAASRPA